MHYEILVALINPDIALPNYYTLWISTMKSMLSKLVPKGLYNGEWTTTIYNN